MFEVGQMVRVVRKTSKAECYFWVPEMDACVGQTLLVRGRTDDHLSLLMEDHSGILLFPPYVLGPDRLRS